MNTVELPPRPLAAEPAGTLMRETTARKALLAVFVLLVLLQGAYLFLLGNGVGKYCDGFSESNAIRAADAYLKEGLTSYHGLPRQAYGTRLRTEGFAANPAPSFHNNPNEWVYTHYPEGPDVLTALAGRVVGLDHLWLLRLFPLSLCLLATAVFFWSLARAFGTARAALVAAACVLLPAFDTHMPALHFQGYSQALFFFQMSLLISMYWREAAVTWRHWAAFFLFGFFQGWLSFDQFFVVSLIAWPFWLLRRSEGVSVPLSRLFWPVVLVVGGFGFAHLLHLLQVAGEMGGLGAAITEFRNTAAERGGQTGVAMAVPQMLQGRLFAFLRSNSEHLSYLRSFVLASYLYVRDFLHPVCLQFCPLLPLTVMVAGWAALVGKINFRLPRFGQGEPRTLTLTGPREVRVLQTLLAALFVSVVWLLVMPGHTVGNHHITVRHFLVFYIFLVLTLAKNVQVKPGARA